MTISAALKLDAPPSAASDLRIAWFSARGCVVRDGAGCCSVFMSGSLVGTFLEDDTARRNAILIGLAEDPKVHLGRLSAAFGLSSEAVRQLRRLFETEGLNALLERTRGGDRNSKLSAAERRRLEKLFAAGATLARAQAALRKPVSLSTVARARAAWKVAQVQPQETILAVVPDAPARQSELPLNAEVELAEAVQSDAEAGGQVAALPLEVVPAGDGEAMDGALLGGGSGAMAVQHLGSWLMVAMVNWLGLHERAGMAAEGRVDPKALRVCLDAVIAALALGEGCVEGVRRLATPTARTLLLASHAPSPNWTRQMLGRLAEDEGAAALHLAMARDYAATAEAAAGGAGPVFYVDNHLRPYTGKHVIRRGWRMQDKRVRPGASDYYVHDEDGRPVGRITAPAHGSLTDFLTPIGRLLRSALPEEPILLAFDRAGAFPEQMSELREEGLEFVTYERKPYPLLPSSAFEEVDLDGERVGISDSRVNLGAGRGRVRRIALRTEEGRQVNLLAVSARAPLALVRIMRGRWNQENAFKHGVERWGLNQLDGRVVEHYPPGTIIPNPARRRLDRALRVARVQEGLLRSELARLSAEHPRRPNVEAALKDSLEQQVVLESQRPAVPVKAELRNTEFAGRLVHHSLEYKLLLDTIRVACANAESDLAAELALHLPRPKEAKKTLANLFAAPGRVRVTEKAITTTLEPAGTRAEYAAFAALMEEVNARRLTLPGDQKQRPLKFRVSQV